MWNYEADWPAELNDMTFAAQLLACTHLIRAYQSSVEAEEAATWGREEAETAVANLRAPEALLPPGALVGLTHELQSFRQKLGELPEAFLATLEQEARSVLLRNLHAAPETTAQYSQRLQALETYDWLRQYAWNIPRGWVALFEKSARLLETAPEPSSEDWRQTDEVKEKYGTLRWYVSGDALFQQVAFLAEEMSEFCCLACGREGSLHEHVDLLLTLCQEHKEMLPRASHALGDLMYGRSASLKS